ncbi:vomeronasal type-1 receptor 4-like [Grammomys surdaster]|uniref:vomeronasal type-1 receptor 4-like n=1 Tax=Grammomys surdaster TaxID=491861 RepID=UPI00109EE9F0|nr:vomeronasal type-1 receptor 4-like [Grammomys surdaster]
MDGQTLLRNKWSCYGQKIWNFVGTEIPSHLPLHDPQVQTSGNDGMTARNMALGIIFLSQTTFGLLGNSFIFFNFLLLYFSGYKLNSTDWILNYFVVANCLTLLCKGVPQTMAAFGLKYLLSDFGCTLLFYIHKMGRSTCICSSSLLSVFQAITISNRNFMGQEFKFKSSKFTGFFLCLCCILNIPLSSYNLYYMTRKLGHRNMTILQNFGICSGCLDKTGQILHTLFLPLPDAVYLGLLVWASISIVLILHKHNQRIEHIPRNKHSSKPSTESRVIKTILLQLSTYMFFYIASCLFQMFMSFLHNPSCLLINISIVIFRCFPAMSPFLLMNQYPIPSSHSVPWIRNCQEPDMIRNI